MGRVFFGGGKVGMKKPGSRLPSGYTELAYIQSSGTQYIKTEITPNQNTRLVMDFQILESQTSQGYVFGCRETGVGFFWLLFNGSVFSTRYGNQSAKSFSSGINAYSRLTVDKNKNVTTLGGETVSHTAGTLTTALTINLFADSHNGDPSYYTAMKLYSCQIYDNNVLVRDFVPCMSDADGMGLYDLVNGKFYGNAGTGSFVGSEVAA